MRHADKQKLSAEEDPEFVQTQRPNTRENVRHTTLV